MSLVAVSVIGLLILLGRTLALFIKGPASAAAVLALGIILVAVAIRAGPHHGPSSGRGTTTRPPAAQ